MPTLNKVIRNQGTYFIVIMNSSENNQCTWWSPLKCGRIFSKKSFSCIRGQKIFGQKNYGVVFLTRRTNDQIIPRFG